MKRRTKAQRMADIRRGEKMSAMLHEMVDTIMRDEDVFSAMEDPSVYMDRNIMGNYVNNPLMAQIVGAMLRKRAYGPATLRCV